MTFIEKIKYTFSIEAFNSAYSLITSKIQQAYKGIVDRFKNYFYPASTNDSDKSAAKNPSTRIYLNTDELNHNTNEYTECDDIFDRTHSNTPRSATNSLDLNPSYDHNPTLIVPIEDIDDLSPGYDLAQTPNQLIIFDPNNGLNAQHRSLIRNISGQFSCSI